MSTKPPKLPDDAGFPGTAAELRRAFGAVELEPATRARHLHTLREHAATAPVPQPATGARTHRGWRLRRRFAAAATAALLLLTLSAGSAVAASSDALPGEALYPVKQATEWVQLRMPAGSETAVERRLSLAERRLEELDALAARGDVDPAVIAKLMDAWQGLVDDSAGLAEGDAALESLVAAATARAHDRLSELLDGDLPAAASDRAREALEGARDRLKDGPPARPEDAGPPATPGRPEAPGQPETSSQPETSGRPESAGPPETAPGSQAAEDEASPRPEPTPARPEEVPTGQRENPGPTLEEAGPAGAEERPAGPGAMENRARRGHGDGKTPGQTARP